MRRSVLILRARTPRKEDGSSCLALPRRRPPPSESQGPAAVSARPGVDGRAFGVAMGGASSVELPSRGCRRQLLAPPQVSVHPDRASSSVCLLCAVRGIWFCCVRGRSLQAQDDAGCSGLLCAVVFARRRLGAGPLRNCAMHYLALRKLRCRMVTGRAYPQGTHSPSRGRVGEIDDAGAPAEVMDR